jgi:hypothetical protein
MALPDPNWAAEAKRKKVFEDIRGVLALNVSRDFVDCVIAE